MDIHKIQKDSSTQAALIRIEDLAWSKNIFEDLKFEGFII